VRFEGGVKTVEAALLLVDHSDTKGRVIAICKAPGEIEDSVIDSEVRRFDNTSLQGAERNAAKEELPYETARSPSTPVFYTLA
jgi:hypothetical protein